MKKTNQLLTILGTIAFVVECPVHGATTILADRAGLNSLPNTTLATEYFESYAVDNGKAVWADYYATHLDSTTIAGAQGPGLVIPGFIITGQGIQWNGDGYFGLITKTVLFGSRTVSIDFTQPVEAFGIDLEAFRSCPITVDVVVYGKNNTTVLTSKNGISIPGSGVAFFGASDPSGIGKVEFINKNTDFVTWSPILDNLSFSAVPEPSTYLAGLSALGMLGLFGWRSRK